MIQNIITRMSGNLFILKGWTITLIVALFTVAAKNEEGIYILFSFFSIAIFWLLDGYFLSMERCYRDLYNSVSRKKENNIDFSMNFTKYMKGKNTWIRSMFSKTLFIFYGTLTIVIIAVTINLKVDSIKFALDVNCADQKVKEVIKQPLKE